jgi:hypothetical protein
VTHTLKLGLLLIVKRRVPLVACRCALSTDLGRRLVLFGLERVLLMGLKVLDGLCSMMVAHLICAWRGDERESVESEAAAGR